MKLQNLFLFIATLGVTSASNVSSSTTIFKLIEDQERFVLFNSRRLSGECKCPSKPSPTESPTGSTGSEPAPTDSPSISPSIAAGQGGCRKPPEFDPYGTGVASYMIAEGCPDLVPHAYYPDPENCAGYCKSTGTNAPCRYEVVDLTAPLVVDPYGSWWGGVFTYSDVRKNGSASGNRVNPNGGTNGILQPDTRLWPTGSIVPDLSHCKYWPDRDGGTAGGNPGTPPPPTNKNTYPLGNPFKD